MKVYKYRGGNFKRDLFSIEKNYFWAPDFTNLNDPSETTITSNKLNQQTKYILPLLGKSNVKLFEPVKEALSKVLSHSEKVGIYSLSKTFDEDRKSTRLNSSHVRISYAVFCLKKK